MGIESMADHHVREPFPGRLCRDGVEHGINHDGGVSHCDGR